VNGTTSANSQRRTAFVTGAATGIGAAVAVALARNGYDVAISARQPERLSDTARQISALGVRALPLGLDLCSLEAMEPAVAKVFHAFGHLDALVNNAGATLRKPALDVTLEEWESVMLPNLRGTFFLCQKAGQHMIASGAPGCIINLSSAHGLLGFPNRSVYGISKAALIHMTRMLAIEWAEFGIRVNAIAPGTVETASRAEILADPKVKEIMLNRVPLRRFATPQEVAEAVCYLASPGAAYMTGQTLILDGGLTAY
jgi:NAD(P)-dependent dehydrogenase (short-subunit alcohol dehydrogenase family)